MRLSESSQDMELPSLRKKFMDKKFTAGCLRDVIRTVAERFGPEHDDHPWKMILAMRSCEPEIAEAMKGF